MNEITSEDDLELHQAWLKAHGFKFEESDDGKSESDEELRSIKPPSVPYNNFKDNIVKIGNNSRIKKKKKKKKRNDVSNRKIISEDLNENPTFQKQSIVPGQDSSTLTAMTHVNEPTPSEQHNVLYSRNCVSDNEWVLILPRKTRSIPRRPDNTFAGPTRKSIRQQNALPSNGNTDSNKFVSFEVLEEHPDESIQITPVSKSIRTKSTFPEVARKSTLHQQNAPFSKHNVDDNKLVPSSAHKGHTTKPIQSLAVSASRQTSSTINGRRKANPHQDNASANKNNLNGKKLDLSIVFEKRTGKPTQILSVLASKQTNNTSAKLMHESTLHQYNASLNRNNVYSNRLVLSEVLEEHTGKSTQITPISKSIHTKSTFAEVTRKSILKQHKASSNKNNVDDNQLLLSKVHEERAIKPTQIRSVSSSRQANTTSAKTTRKAKRHQDNAWPNKNHNVNGDKLVSYEILEEHTGESTQILSVSSARQTSSSFNEVTRKSTLHKHHASNNNNIDDNRLVSSKVHEEHATKPTQILSVSGSRQTNNTFAKMTHKSTLHQDNASRNKNNVDGNILVSSKVLVERVGGTTQIFPVAISRRTDSSFAEVTHKSTEYQHIAASTQILLVASPTHTFTEVALHQRDIVYNEHNIDGNKLFFSRVYEEHTTRPTCEYLIQKQQRKYERVEENRELPVIKAKVLSFLCCQIIYEILMRLW